MADFSQNGVITTLQTLKDRPIEDLESELMTIAQKRKMVLLLPALVTEFDGPAMPGIIEKLKSVGIPLLAAWVRIAAAIPDFTERLNEAVEQDNRLKNRREPMKKFIVIFCLLTFIFVLIPPHNALANPEINYDKKKHLLSIHAEMISFMAVLHDVEIKTGIKITIHGRIPDKYITLTMDQLPIDCIGNLMGELSLNNTALLYDQKGNISEIFILP